MSGFELLSKYFPIVGACAAVFIGYGSLTAQLDNIETVQKAQYEQLSHRLDRIEDRINIT